MKTFSIAELEQFSLIRAHTFRAWEKRYNMFRSNRTMTNLRFYTTEDLSYLLNISLLNRLGNKISLLASFDRKRIVEMVLSLKDDKAKQEHCINQLIIQMFSLEIEDFEFTLESAMAAWGNDTAVDDVILPLLERLELFCYKGHTSCEYHLVVTALRRKLISAIERSKPARDLEKSTVLFLPEGEHYDLLLLYLNYKLRNLGFNVIYLGTNITSRNLQDVIKRKKPNVAITYISPEDKKNLQDIVYYLPKETDTSFLITTAKLPDHPHHFQKHSTLISYREVSAAALKLESQNDLTTAAGYSSFS